MLWWVSLAAWRRIFIDSSQVQCLPWNKAGFYSPWRKSDLKDPSCPKSIRVPWTAPRWDAVSISTLSVRETHEMPQGSQTKAAELGKAPPLIHRPWKKKIFPDTSYVTPTFWLWVHFCMQHVPIPEEQTNNEGQILLKTPLPSWSRTVSFIFCLENLRPSLPQLNHVLSQGKASMNSTELRCCWFTTPKTLPEGIIRIRAA